MIRGEMPEAFCLREITMATTAHSHLKAGKEVTHTGKESNLKEAVLVSLFWVIPSYWPYDLSQAA